MQPISTGGPVGGGTLGLGMGGMSNVLTGSGGGRTAMGPGGLYVASSFGVDNTTLMNFKARSFINSERVRDLARRESYYRATHHDWKMFDFDGRQIQPGPPTSQPLLSAESASWYVPLRMRRPSSPYRLARVIVNSFTALMFGYKRWPTVRVHGDPVSEDFVTALIEATKLHTLMIRARNLGGSCGSVGLSWKFYDGKPCVQAHSAKHLYVHSWADREQLIPEHVSEVYTYPRDEYDQSKAKWVRNWYWYRRDWTPLADVVFHESLFSSEVDPQWRIDEEKTVTHKHGKCHFVWVQNLPEDDGTSIDGQPDYGELYENFESLDIIKSVVVRGAQLNLDPTLVLKLDPDIVARSGVRKGSDNSLLVGESGGAEYMELQGTSITVGIDLFKKLREAALEVAQCVIPDPNQIGAAGTSSVALKVVYEPMLAKAEVLRGQYGDALARVLGDMLEYAIESANDVQVETDDDGSEREVRAFIDVPARLDLVSEPDPNDPTKRIEKLVKTERVPGQGGKIELDWPDYFNPTPDDQQKTVTTLSQGVTSKIMSQQTAADEVAAIYGLNPRTEWARLEDEKKRDRDAQMATIAASQGAAGGEVDDLNALPPGAEPLKPKATEEEHVSPFDEGDEVEPEHQPMLTAAPANEESSKLMLTGTDLATITTVNEGRASVGLGVLLMANGSPDPDGSLTITEFKAKREAKGDALGGAIGEAQGDVVAPGPPAAPVGPPK